VTGQHYFSLEVDVPDDQMKQIDGMAVLPGMPIEAFLETGERSVLAYLLKPLTDHLGKAFREQ
jgi:HlyD family secretion protein